MPVKLHAEHGTRGSMLCSEVPKRTGSQHSQKIFAVGYKPRLAGVPVPPRTKHIREKRKRGPKEAVTRPSRNFRRLNFGFVPGYAPPCPDRNDPTVIADCVYKRLGAELPDADPNRVANWSEFVGRYLHRRIATVGVGSVDFDHWIENSPYNGERRAQLRAARELDGGRCPPWRVLKRIPSFIKLEHFDEPKHARAINPICDRFKAYAGPYVHAMEEIVYNAPEFIKHTPVPERPAKIAALTRQGCRYYENDYSCFEGSLRKMQQEAVEHQLFRHMLKQFPAVAADFVRMDSMEKKLVFRSCFHAFYVEYTRASGISWTSLCNGFHNLMTVKYICWEKDGRVGLGESVDGFVEGDDGLFATRHELTKFDFARLGHEVKIKQLDRPSDGHFCGNCMSEDLTLMKDPRRVFRTFGWTSSFMYAGNKIMDSLLRSKALSLTYEMPQCPVVGQLGRTALALTSGVRVTHEFETYRTRPPDFEGPNEPFAPSDIARAEFDRRYHINAETQLAAEEAIRRLDMDELSTLIPPTSFDVWYESRHIEYD